MKKRKTNTITVSGLFQQENESKSFFDSYLRNLIMLDIFICLKMRYHLCKTKLHHKVMIMIVIKIYHPRRKCMNIPSQGLTVHEHSTIRTDST